MSKQEPVMVEVQVSLYKPFHDFMKEYLAFFGSKQTIEDLCRNMVYDGVKLIYLDLEGAVPDPQAWLKKWPHIAIAASEDQLEEEET